MRKRIASLILSLLLGLAVAGPPAVAEESPPVVAAPGGLRAAAERGDLAAQVQLGLMYVRGQGVTADDAQAAQWFRRAAERGHADGQYNLGLLHVRGSGVAQDDVEAYKWLTLAAERGLDEALSVRDGIAGRMTPQQLAKARQLARSWKPVARVP